MTRIPLRKNAKLNKLEIIAPTELTVSVKGCSILYLSSKAWIVDTCFRLFW